MSPKRAAEKATLAGKIHAAGIFTPVVYHSKRTCLRKKRHPSVESARAEAARLGDGNEAYKCRYCVGWHVGRPAPPAEPPCKACGGTGVSSKGQPCRPCEDRGRVK